jgi:CHASE3 domain sensor protein
MRLRIPPFLPPYAVLFLVIAYAVGSLWLGLARLDALTRVTETTARNAAAMHDLGALLNAVNDIETAERGFALTADDAYLEPFERGRRRVPVLLSALRDKMRDDASELALIEELVPLIAERSMITAAGIERKRNVPGETYETVFGRRGKESSERIRTVITILDAREQDQLAQARRTLVRTTGEARRDMYVMAAVTLLLVISLFLAVRRLRSFILVVPDARAEDVVRLASGAAPAAKDAGVGTLLRDAMLRARLAAAATPADSSERKRFRSLISAMEHALSEHGEMRDPTRPEDQSIVQALTRLRQVYSRPDGLSVSATIDQSVEVADGQKAFLILRSAEWALEAIMLRKRAGNVTLHLTSDGDRVFLRIHALTDSPKLPVALTPEESQEADALQRGATALAGSFIVGEGPTGFSLTLTVPAEP